jgi:hypothetical protein
MGRYIPQIVTFILHIITAIILVLVAAATLYTLSVYDADTVEVNGEVLILNPYGKPLGTGFWNLWTGFGVGYKLASKSRSAGDCHDDTGWQCVKDPDFYEGFGCMINIQFHGFVKIALLVLGLFAILFTLFEVGLILPYIGPILTKFDAVFWRGVIYLAGGAMTLASCGDLGIAAGTLSMIVSIVWLAFGVIGWVG